MKLFQLNIILALVVFSFSGTGALGQETVPKEERGLWVARQIDREDEGDAAGHPPHGAHQDKVAPDREATGIVRHPPQGPHIIREELRPR